MDGWTPEISICTDTHTLDMYIYIFIYNIYIQTSWFKHKTPNFVSHE